MGAPRLGAIRKDRKLISRKAAKHALSKVEGATKINISPLRVLSVLARGKASIGFSPKDAKSIR